MGTSVNMLSPADVVPFLGQRLQTTATGLPFALCFAADYLRSNVYSYWCRNPDQTPIHSIRLVNAYKKDVQPWMEFGTSYSELDATLLGQAGILEPGDLILRMSGLGDVLDCGHGRWLPGPLRAIEISKTPPFYLLLGGIPTEVIDAEIREMVQCSGVGRFFIGASGAHMFSEKFGDIESVDDWYCSIDGDLETWTHKTVTNLVSNQGNEINQTTERLEIYLPERTVSSTTLTRWYEAEKLGIPPDGHRLARITGQDIWNTPYFLVTLVSGLDGMRIRNSVNIEKPILDRLRYGFDALVGAPLTVERFQSDRYSVLRLWRPLPEPESRLLSLGWPYKHQENQKHVDWVFPSEYSVVIDILVGRFSLNEKQRDWNELDWGNVE